jgi:hypothetical protein
MASRNPPPVHTPTSFPLFLSAKDQWNTLQYHLHTLPLSDTYASTTHWLSSIDHKILALALVKILSFCKLKFSTPNEIQIATFAFPTTMLASLFRGLRRHLHFKPTPRSQPDQGHELEERQADGPITMVSPSLTTTYPLESITEDQDREEQTSSTQALLYHPVSDRVALRTSAVRSPGDGLRKSSTVSSPRTRLQRALGAGA